MSAFSSSHSQCELMLNTSSVIYPSVVVRLSIFSSIIPWLIKTKFLVESPCERGTEVCIKGQGNMVQMANIPIYGKNLLLFYGKVKCGLQCVSKGKAVRKSFNGRTLTENDQSGRFLIIHVLTNWASGACLSCHGTNHMYMNISIFSSKTGQSKPNLPWSIYESGA